MSTITTKDGVTIFYKDWGSGLDLPTGPFYGFNRAGAKASQGVIRNWWRQGMMVGVKAHYDGIVAFSQTDFTENLKKISVPALVWPPRTRWGCRRSPCRDT